VAEWVVGVKQIWEDIGSKPGEATGAYGAMKNLPKTKTRMMLGKAEEFRFSGDAET
jgi:hypothetical protein